MLTDYHVHLRPDEIEATPDRYFTRDRLGLYLEAANVAGIAELGISEHIYRFRQALSVWDHPFWQEWAIDDLDAYCDFLADSPVRCGIEADFIPGREAELEELVGSRRFDYVIGSVHFLGDRSIDTEEFSVWDGGADPDEIWRRYFTTLAAAARSGLFDVLAHPDLVKVWGQAGHRPSFDPRVVYEPAVEAIAESGVAVEVSTAGLRKGAGEIYPAPDFLAICAEAGTAFTLSSDAHRPDQVGYRYELALELLGRYGVKELAVFEGRNRSLVPLKAETGAGCR
jgi:histidinol-phosphatase (PHP family)